MKPRKSLVCVAVPPSIRYRRDESNARKREAERDGERMRERARRTARVRKMEREGVRERKDSSGLLSSS